MVLHVLASLLLIGGARSKIIECIMVLHVLASLLLIRGTRSKIIEYEV